MSIMDIMQLTINFMLNPDVWNIVFLVCAGMLLYEFAVMDTSSYHNEEEVLYVICVDKKSRKFSRRHIDVKHLSASTRKNIKNSIEPLCDKIEKISEKYPSCKEKFLTYGAYFDTLYDDLQDAVTRTNHNYEEKVLVEKMDIAVHLLETLIDSVKEEKIKERDIKKELIKGEIREHEQDFGTSKELISLLRKGV